MVLLLRYQKDMRVKKKLNHFTAFHDMTSPPCLRPTFSGTRETVRGNALLTFMHGLHR